MRIASFIFVGLLVSCAAHESSEKRLPDDVQSFVDRREMCDYFRGEIPDQTDADRMDTVDNAMDKYCTGTDRELSRLKQKYSENARIMLRLNDYEDRIEAVAD